VGVAVPHPPESNPSEHRASPVLDREVSEAHSVTVRPRGGPMTETARTATEAKPTMSAMVTMDDSPLANRSVGQCPRSTGCCYCHRRARVRRGLEPGQGGHSGLGRLVPVGELRLVPQPSLRLCPVALWFAPGRRTSTPLVRGGSSMNLSKRGHGHPSRAHGACLLSPVGSERLQAVDLKTSLLDPDA
jgi:hypothetical protein